MSSKTPKPVPGAAYRLQFTKDFGFAQATDLHRYLQNKPSGAISP
jgi:maltooligosyltrehalose synthase